MGPKKKSKANKLARMSDEERARYLQHRADIEEEARRRKQQLIAMFMRNKLKREEAFARLNLAKINEYWRKILRDVKCRQMKEELTDDWKNFERIMECKRLAIDGHILELEEAEAQYQNNLQAHMVSLDNLIDFHSSALDDLRDKFLSKKRILIDASRLEREVAEQKYNDDLLYLKRLQFSKIKSHNKETEEMNEKHIDILNEAKHDCIEDVLMLTTKKEAELEEMWERFKKTLNDYLEQTKEIRADYEDLSKKEVEDTNAIREISEKIEQATNQIANLKAEFTSFREEHKLRIDNLLKQKMDFLEHHSNIKKKMIAGNAKDKSQACVLVTSANKAIKYLANIKKKGDQLLYMFSLCSKYETEKEKLLPWGPNNRNLILIDGSASTSSVNEDDDEKENRKNKEFQILTKDLELDKMNRFWCRVNQAQIDCMDLNAEKKTLTRENIQLKKALRAYLTELALSQNNKQENSSPEYFQDEPSFISCNSYRLNKPLTGVEAATCIAVRHEAQERKKLASGIIKV